MSSMAKGGLQAKTSCYACLLWWGVVKYFCETSCGRGWFFWQRRRFSLFYIAAYVPGKVVGLQQHIRALCANRNAQVYHFAGKDDNMPECYTHAYIATHALMRSGQTVASHPAFLAGANGPDPLAMHQFWKRQGRGELPELSSRMHKEKTGEFLNALVQYAITPVQQSYVLGFLTHYTTDCTLNPFIAAMSMTGAPYEGPHGARKLKTALDSALYHKDYKTYLVPMHAGTPVLITEDLAQVSSLLHEVILNVYELDIPAIALADTFHDNSNVRKYLVAKSGVSRGWKYFSTPFRIGAKRANNLLSRMQPGQPLKNLPGHWVNPFTGEELNLTLDEVVALAEQTGGACIAAAMHFWLGEIQEGQLKEILGDNNYYTGLPIGAARAE